MNITNIINAPWAILQENYNEIRAVVDAHLRGPKLNLKDMEARILSVESDTFGGSYEVKNGAAIIPVKGPMAKNPDIFDRVILGIISMADIRSMVQTAIEDMLVKNIVFHIDSPGSTVDGMQELASFIYESRDKKPMIAFSDGWLCSGAYWLGAAVGKIFISSDTVNVGSIGVRQVFIETTKMDEEIGLKTNEIIAGRYKNAGSPNIPMSDSHREYFQAQIDYVYSVFINDVAMMRGKTPEEVLAMADGKIYIGKQAIEVGLVDGVSTLADLIDSDSIAGPGAGSRRVQKIEKSKEAEMQITAEILQKEHPEVYAAVIAAGKAEAAKENEAAMKAEYERGKSEELARVKGVNAQAMPGHEKLIADMVLDGKSSAADAAQAIIKAENEKRAGVLGNLKNGQKPVGHSEPKTEIEGGSEDYMALVAAHRKEHGCSMTEALQACAKKYPGKHREFVEQKNQK